MSNGVSAYPVGWPSTATIPYNLGGSTSGKYTDRNGKTFDGTGWTVVDIDGAFRTDNPVFKTTAGKSKVIAEACFGQKTGTTWGSLCKSQAWTSRPLPGDPSAGYWSAYTSGISRPSDSPDNICRDSNNPDTPQYCHHYHGTATAGVMVGQQTGRLETDGTQLFYTGVAPGAQVFTLKVGGGTGTIANAGWPINSVVDALNYVYSMATGMDGWPLYIAAVNISANGSSIAGELPCGTGSEGARIDEIAGKLKAMHIAVVMVAGNDAMNGGTGTWTCGKNVIVVGATCITNPTVPTDYTNISQKVALFAPVGTANRTTGDFVLAPWAGAGSFYVRGTSFAAPQVAAAFAVLRQKFGPDPSVDALAQLMKATGKPLTGQRAGLAAPGASVLNIKAALDGPTPAADPAWANRQ
ncbi:S8 family serine peptidase [Paraburkholderia acidisoli]|uniref:S8 family serine peptidase n=2 Tax=Paraburkholderia acidisoli TaxID=2571748 RepID=A0A7Z2GMM9_9BURK|nr:S8 family serine peptidase [Paraburkholderia acidisoli]